MNARNLTTNVTECKRFAPIHLTNNRYFAMLATVIEQISITNIGNKMNHSLDAIFRPKSVAVVGASARKGSLGREIFDKLLNTEFNGPLYPVNPNAKYIHSVKAYASISAIHDAVDLAVVVVPKEHVFGVLHECAENGVKGVVVITAGFRETGERGAAEEQKMVKLIKSHGMRMVGPNCMGIINSDPEVRLDTTFAPTVPDTGNIALASQSGALGQTILEHAHELNLGISMFISVGNKADVSGNDLLEYWKDDPAIDVILMYLEGFDKPRRFIELARETSRKKPIVVVKSGRTSSGARAATSHTGALAGMDVAYDALFKQCGVIRADTINDMFDFAMGFANVPLPRGNRVAIVTNAGGPGIMAADACESFGLEVAELAEKTRKRLQEELVPDASVDNPVDLLAGAQPEEFLSALTEVLHDKNIDAAIVIFVAPIITNPQHVALKIAEAAAEFDKPVLGCFMGVRGVARGIEELHRQRIPAYPFPESAARTLAAMVRYSVWLEQPQEGVVSFEVDTENARKIVRAAIREQREYLTPGESLDMLNIYGIPCAKAEICRDLQEILGCARKMQFPLVLKVASVQVVHKSEVGGVKLNLQTEAALRSAYEELRVSLQAHDVGGDLVGFLVQEMVVGGREIIMGLHNAGKFGSLVAFGLGGIYVEVLRDVVFRIAPITGLDAVQMMEEINGYPILQGIRGEKPIAFAAVKEVLMRLSQLSVDLPEIQELDLNPFLVFPEKEKCVSVDVRIRVA